MSKGTLHLNKNLESLSQLNGAEAKPLIVESDQPLEPILAAEGLDKLAEDEKFMAEIVEVVIAETTDENLPDHIVLNVNGTNQPIFRGVATKIKRCYLEVLARCKETKYTQVRDPNQPDRTDLRPRTAHAYPFTVVSDRNPRGGSWLKSVMLEAA